MQVTDNVIATSEVFSVMKDGIIICTPDNQYIKLEKEQYFEAMKRIEPAMFVLDYEETADEEVSPIEEEKTENSNTKDNTMTIQTQTTEQQLINLFQSLDCYPKNLESLPFIFFELANMPNNDCFLISPNGLLEVLCCGFYSVTYHYAEVILNRIESVTNVRFGDCDTKSFDYPFVSSGELGLMVSLSTPAW